jgi:hypothetical protein
LFGQSHGNRELRRPAYFTGRYANIGAGWSGNQLQDDQRFLVSNLCISSTSPTFMVKTASNPVGLMLKGNHKIRHLISVQRLKASSSKAVQNSEKAREGDTYTHNWQAAMG